MTTLFLHPLGLDGQCWQFTDLDGATPDIPGHGRTPARGDLTLESAADDMLDMVPGVLDIVGLSLGGALAIRMALRAPVRVRSIMVACSGVLDTPERSERLRDRAASTERTGMAGVADTTLERWFTAAARGAPEHPGVRYARARLLSDDPHAFAAWWRAMAAHRVHDEIGSIRCPVTVLAGREDAAAPTSQMIELFDAFRGPRRMEIVPGPHMLQLEQPQAFAEAVRLHSRWVEWNAGHKHDA